MRRLALAVLLGALGAVSPVEVSAGPIDTLQPGEWYEVPNSHLASVLPSPVPPGGTGPSSIMTAWSGGAYDTRRDRLIVWGGGHGDYGGNEIYTFDINSLTWSRVWGPSPYDMILAQMGASCVDTYQDGNPVSRHTYDGLEYLPNQDRFWFHGGSRFCGSGGAGIDTWTFDFVGGRWERKADVPKCNGCGELEHTTGYDPATGHVFLAFPGYSMYEYDPVANTWTERSSQGIGYSKSGVIDTKRRKFLAMGGGQVMIYDLNTPGNIPMQQVSTTGANSIVNPRYPGLAYDPVTDRIVAWAGGADVYTLNMDTLVWTRHTPAASNTVVPTQPPGAGTYGRFRYIPSKNAFIVVNDIYGDVYFYKLAAGGGAPTDTIPPSAPASLRTR